MVYLITYDLKKPGQQYEELHKAIKACGSWWHFLESTWLVDTSLSAQKIWDHLAPHVDKGDYMLIVGVTAEHQGWLPQEAWNWITTHQQKQRVSF